MTGRFRSGSPPKNVSSEGSRDARDRARAQSSPRPSRPSRGSSCRQTCCSRRDRPGSSSRRRSCTGAWSSRVTLSSEVSFLTAEKYLSSASRSNARSGHQEAVLRQQRQSSRSSSLTGHTDAPVAKRSRNSVTSGDTSSCASLSVFIRNTSFRSGSGTRTLKMDGCICSISSVYATDRRRLDSRGCNGDSILRNSSRGSLKRSRIRRS